MRLTRWFISLRARYARRKFQRRILAFLRTHPDTAYSTEDIRKVLGHSPDTKWVLVCLDRAGKIAGQYHPPRKRVYWMIRKE